MAPKLAEPTLASLVALGVAASDMGASYRTALQTLFETILAGPACSCGAPKSDGGTPVDPHLTLLESECPNVSQFRAAVLDDLKGAASSPPEVEAASAAVHRLVAKLGLG